MIASYFSLCSYPVAQNSVGGSLQVPLSSSSSTLPSPPHTPFSTTTSLPRSPSVISCSSSCCAEDDNSIDDSDLSILSDYEGDEEDDDHSEDDGDSVGTEEGGVGLPPLNDSSDILSSSDSLSSEEDDDNSDDGGDSMNTVEEGGVGLPPLNDSSDLLSSSDSLSSEEDNGDQIEGEETVDLKSSSIATKKTTAFGGAVILLSESSTEEDGDTDTECCEFSLPAPTGHHSSQDHTLQCWEDMLEVAIQQCNSMNAPTMSRTSSEEELATIFGDQDTPVSMPHPPPTSTPPPTQEATYQLFPEEAVKDIDTDFIHKWWEMRNQFLLQQQQSGDHHNLTTTPWTSAEREPRSGHCDTGLNKSHRFHHSAQSAFRLYHEPSIITWAMSSSRVVTITI